MTIETLQRDLQAIADCFKKGYLESEQIPSIRNQITTFENALETELKSPTTENAAAENIPLLSQNSKKTRLEQLDKIKESLSELKKKIAHAETAIQDYQSFLQKSNNEKHDALTHAKSGNPKNLTDVNSRIDTFNFNALPPDLKKLILQSFSLYEKQIMQLVCKDFFRIINESWITDNAIIYPIHDQHIVFFINQPSVRNTENVITVMRLKELMGEKNPEAIQAIIKNITSTTEMELKGPAWRLRQLVVVSIILFIGIISSFLMQNTNKNDILENKIIKDFATAALILDGVMGALFLSNLYFNFPQKIASCYANLKYGSFFSSIGQTKKPYLITEKSINPDLTRNNDAAVSTTVHKPQISEEQLCDHLELVIHENPTEQYYDARENFYGIATAQSTRGITGEDYFRSTAIAPATAYTQTNTGDDRDYREMERVEEGFPALRARTT